MKYALTICAAAVALALPGCAGSMLNPGSTSNVSVFHTLDSVPKSATFTVVGWREELDNSLEFRNYALQLGKIMSKEGLRVVPPGQAADYIAYLDYGIDQGQEFSYTYYRPQWGEIFDSQTTSSTITDTPNGQQVDSTVTNTGQRFGVTGYNPEQRVGVNFQRFVNIDIVPADGGRNSLPVMEMRLRSAGTCGSISTLMPRFMKAIERRFDDKSGKAGRLVTAGGRC